MAAVTREDEDNLFLNSFCFGFRVHDASEHLPLFLAYYFRGSPGRHIMRALAQGATRYNMSKSQFKALALSLPQHDEQKAIATVLCDMDAEIAALEARRDKTRNLKQAMMQELLTGIRGALCRLRPSWRTYRRNFPGAAWQRRRPIRTKIRRSKISSTGRRCAGR